ncbi:MAG: hypothetical protein M1816_003945 [Peltula sp. TS41687]|nr:MAG: hypothetical protein M1816_003945 [Peltula sp. TS41687]
MPLFTSPTAFDRQFFQKSALDISRGLFALQSPASEFQSPAYVSMEDAVVTPLASQTPFGHLVLLVFEAVLEVVCVSLPGYIVARQGMFDVESQKFLANLNVALFTPCLIFTKLASQLTASKLPELAIIPAIFLVQTLVSYLCSIGVSRLFGFKRRPRNFVVAMGVFGNSNSLPISLVLSLSKTISGLHWDRIPGDTDGEVGARGILYLLIFQQLGQLLRWSWGYHVLLAPPHKFNDEPEHAASQVEQGRGRYQEIEEPDVLADSADDLSDPPKPVSTSETHDLVGSQTEESEYDSGGQTPINYNQYTNSLSSKVPSQEALKDRHAALTSFPTPTNGNFLAESPRTDEITTFPPVTLSAPEARKGPLGTVRGWLLRAQSVVKGACSKLVSRASDASKKIYAKQPKPVQQGLTKTFTGIGKFMRGLWEFMNPPLWAMLAAIIVASVPSLQQLFFTPGTFIQNSVTSAVQQSGGVAVPLILVVLGANLARTTVENDPHEVEDASLNRKLLIASLISRMLLPTVIMAPLLALTAKYVPVSILDDPIFVVICFLLTGAPSALQLAQICQINGVYESVMSRLLFQSYVIWILPSTLLLVMTALEVVKWAAL